MNLENIENKKILIENFFAWIFEDNRFNDKNLILESEIDLTLAPYYMDANIYYPKQIADFFNTKAMKRLGRISQLNLTIDEYPNTYHNRLEHSKGVYNKKLEEMLDNFENPSWKKYIEDNNLRLYLLAELIKMAGHDIGHLPLSHALEVEIFSERGVHEFIGKRIMLENKEIQSVLSSISSDLPMAIKDLYEKDILNFKAHDESNYDVDRLDYISRDNFYIGTPLSLPHAHYESIPVSINASGNIETNTDGSLRACDKSNYTIDVYEHSSLCDIEKLLESRENSYKQIYFSTKTHIRENSISDLFKSFLSSKSHSGEDLKNYINCLKNCDINNVDLSLFLEWDDINFYSQILDIAENHEDKNVQNLAILTLPNMKAFLTLLYSHLGLCNKSNTYCLQDETFLKNIKKLIKSDNYVSANLKNPNFSIDNTLIFPSNTTLPSDYNKYIKDGLIHSTNLKIRAYNKNNPIYIKSLDGKIYELSKHPDRKYDWDTKVTYKNNIYAYIPFLKFNGLSDDKIAEMRSICNTTPHPLFSKKNYESINMQPLQVGHNIEDCFLEL